ncbi:lycopene cyclase domain-containing protein [Arthrobacter gandavensis]|uniref:lycopene cyclase domain-containing protein n=1 Tax=Arthrobacter gandavensis TaxID=169960 RepID=UPI00188FE1F6|nr:lycopene cyclase domain-containing protein [Arthrobacter gandavensis]MBF4993980.1 lycopene cyclase domain-containing protein [Arthrobacter gandavensis]
MTYWVLNLCFLVPAAALLSAALLRRRRTGLRNRAFTLRLAGTAGVLLGLTAVFDNLMIAVDLFGYNPSRISGAFLGLAPLEDFAYPLAAVLLLPALWELLSPRTAAPSKENQ